MLPKVLFTSPIIEFPAVGGPALRIANSIKALSLASNLSVISPVADSDATPALKSFLAANTIAASFRKEPTISRTLPSRILRKLKLTNSVRPQPFEEMLLSAVRSGEFDVLWLGYGNISYSLLKYIKQHAQIPVVVDTDSVWSRYVLRGLPYATSDSERDAIQKEGSDKEVEERWGTELADVTTAVSEVDAEYYRTLAGNPSKVHIFANVVDIGDYAAITRSSPAIKPNRVFLAGSFWPNSPMEHAARWYLTKVLPILRARRLNVHTYIAGKDSDQVLANVLDDDVTILGRVDTVLPYLFGARASIVPLWFESGTRFKILEAGACGTPVVSTTLGAEGIPVVHNQELFLADTPEDFADGIQFCCEHPERARALALGLKKVVEHNYSIEALSKQASSILEHIRNSRVLHPSD